MFHSTFVFRSCLIDCLQLFHTPRSGLDLLSRDTPRPVERDGLLSIGGTLTMFRQEPHER
jgi:hypothetical protein